MVDCRFIRLLAAFVFVHAKMNQHYEHGRYDDSCSSSYASQLVAFLVVVDDTHNKWTKHAANAPGEVGETQTGGEILYAKHLNQ